jgi:DNA-binding NarL/FixJ family response regulator
MLNAAADGCFPRRSRIFISVKTVSTYRSRILSMLGITDNAELILYAVPHGIIV